VLQEAPDEFFGRQRAQPGFSAVTILVAERDLITDHSLDALVAEGDTEHVARQILQRWQTVPHRLAMHDPILFPDFSRYTLEPARLSQPVAKLGPEQDPQRPDREEETSPGRQPGLPVAG
jgi:hypothetical protein